ncbi:MAG: hypothetical protein QY332_12005 [Anaerolineales bacterium]|nr:MAG: hypothetical protein QY332_12005 [Anaerolineales bacterium]
MLLGKHASTLDKLNRFKLPEGFVEEMTGEIYLIQGFEQNLLCLTTDSFREICTKITAQNITDPLARLLSRMILGSAQIVNIDIDGFILIPNVLAEFINAQDLVYIVGQGEYFEIWSSQHWLQQEAQLLDCEQNSSRFSALPITIH